MNKRNKNNVYFVLPKESSYLYKDIEIRTIYEERVKEWFDLFNSKGFNIICFAEDFLAVRLLHDREIKWITTVGTADSYFLEKLVDGYHEAYKDIHKEKVNEDLISESLERAKTKNPKEYIDKTAYLGGRLSILQRRVKIVAESVLQSASIVLYVNANNNYCRVPTPSIGDSKLIIVVEAITGVTQYTYGGVTLSRKEFDLVLGGLNGNI